MRNKWILGVLWEGLGRVRMTGRFTEPLVERILDRDWLGARHFVSPLRTQLDDRVHG